MRFRPIIEALAVATVVFVATEKLSDVTLQQIELTKIACRTVTEGDLSDPKTSKALMSAMEIPAWDHLTADDLAETCGFARDPLDEWIRARAKEGQPLSSQLELNAAAANCRGFSPTATRECERLDLQGRGLDKETLSTSAAKLSGPKSIPKRRIDHST